LVQLRRQTTNGKKRINQSSLQLGCVKNLLVDPHLDHQMMQHRID
jgi:hypothetical protein